MSIKEEQERALEMTKNNSIVQSQHNNSERGFTLIEGMVAAVVVAVGLIALTGMQAISLSYNVDANETTRATNLAADMLERIQFNRRNVDSYATVLPGVFPSVINASTICPASLPIMTRGDCNQWKNLLTSTYAAGLNGVQGVVTVGAVGTGGVPALLNQRSVQVRLTWTGATGASKLAKARQVTLMTRIAPE
jgi:type IV pilus assembly protein PilV